MGVSKNNGTPQIIHFNRGFPWNKPSILGGKIPLFLVQHPYQQENNWPTQRVIQSDSTQSAFTGLGELEVLDLLSPAKRPQTMIGVCFSYIY